MSATDTSQSSSDFLKSSRLPGDFELNSWTQGLAGAPRPNPAPVSTVSSQAPNLSSQNPHSLSTNLNSTGVNSTTSNRYPQSNPSLRYDQKAFSSNQALSSNPFLSSPSMGQGGENRPEPKANLRETWNQAQTSDLQSFDLSSYVHSQSRPSPTTTPRDYLSPKTEQSASGGGFNNWGHQSPVPLQENAPHQASFDQLSATDSGTVGGEHEDYDTDGSGGAYESRFANKKILIFAVLVGALILGGGVSYLYNSFFGSDTEGPTPIVKNAQGPSKVKPTDPGGKQFAHSDSKILGRLTESSSTTETDPSSETRKVSTLTVGRDGTIQPPSTTETQNAPSTVSVPVPGMTLIDGVPSNEKSALSSSENTSIAGTSPDKSENISSEASKRAEVKASENSLTKEATLSQTTPHSQPTKPKGSPTDNGVQASSISSSTSSNSQSSISSVTNNSTEPSQLGNAEKGGSSSGEGKSKSTLTEADLEQPSSQKKLASASSQPVSVDSSLIAKPKTEPKTAAFEPASKPSRVQSVQPSGMGYVAVLASVPVSGNSRMTALQQYADLQQKYSGILQSKTPDVQEANLAEKGRYHRLIIGPPGSKEAANSICVQLKSAGYSSCWIMAY